ncbi:hypothetical protein [Pseudomonas hygromyciniae]|uniref:hypothetical protein n=1 Tax=Pseudomonas hygromyciniae TaxID=2812000 RepID=UPI0035CBCCAF
MQKVSHDQKNRDNPSTVAATERIELFYRPRASLAKPWMPERTALATGRGSGRASTAGH